MFFKMNNEHNEQRMSFDKYMNAANNVGSDKAALKRLIRLLGRKIQSQFLVNSILNGNKDIAGFNDFFLPAPYVIADTRTNKACSELVKEIDIDENLHTLNLNRDVVLTLPHRADSIINMLKWSNNGRHPRGEWKQDSNHKVWYWHPVGVGLVHNGYHSIAYGIIDGVGEVCCDHAFDLSAAYDFIKADGVHFIRLQDNKPVWQVHSPELAAIFEIGRMLI